MIGCVSLCRQGGRKDRSSLLIGIESQCSQELLDSEVSSACVPRVAAERPESLAMGVSFVYL